MKSTLIPKRLALLAASALVASALPVFAQYADWAANPPKILPNERPGSGAVFMSGSGRQFPNAGAFAALKDDGSVVTWGNQVSGGNSTSVAGSLTSNVTAVYSNTWAFAALKSDGSVVTWGNVGYGGNSTSVAGSMTSNVTAVYSTVAAFAALKSDGSVVTWGLADFGGNSSSVAGSLSSNVTAVYSNQAAFAALKSDGSVVTWGDATYGGNSTAVSGNLSSNVTAVYSNGYAFAALKSDGSVVTWGTATQGGDSSSVSGNLSSNVTAVYSNPYAFAALKNNGSVVSWGWGDYGGNSTSVAGSLSSNVTAVYSTGFAFAALKSDGSVVTWGDATYGGNSTAVSGNLSSNVTAVYSNQAVFAALKNNGSVVTWGDASFGGNSSSVAENLSSNVTSVFSSQFAFAALKKDGSVVTWGHTSYGGNSTSVAGSLSSNVTSVFSNQQAFAALKKDGSVVTWGDSLSGGSGGPTGTGFTSVQSVFYPQPLGASVTASTGNITSTTATLLGEVAKEGKSPVTARGFVYALASIADPKIGDPGVTQLADSGSGLGSYSTLLGGLTPNTPYVFRAYAVNGEGTTYGPVENFSTNLPPVVLSEGGSSTANLTVAENSTAVSTVSATDPDAGQSITYTIGGGADASRFAIGSTSGVVTFATAPDFEAPADADANNVYTVIVQATDTGNPPKSATQTLHVTVTNVADNGILAVEQPAGTALVSGASVNFGNRTIGQPAELTFTLGSLGEAELLLPSGAVLSGAAASDFRLASSVPSVVLIGANGTLTVRFTPSASGNRSATLSIPTNDTRPGGSPYTITLAGNGSATPTIADYSNAASQVLGGWVNGGNFTIGTVGTTSNATNWPSAESPDKVVDANTASKFLIFRNSNAGVILKPTNSSVVFNRLALSTANDASERDPASFILYGSSSNLTGSAGTNIPISSLTPIASGNVTMLDARSAGPTVIQFANTVAYTSYVLVFPTLRNSATATSMQVSEIQLSQGANPPLAVAVADARGGQLSGGNFTFGSIGNSNPGTNWLAAESPDHAMDGNVNTKFAIFRSAGAGLLASPQSGPAPVNSLTLWTANDAPERDPASYQIYGFPTRITQTSGTLAVGNGTLLANGTLTLPAARNSGPVQVEFDNSTPYASYLVVFPTVKNSPTSNLTQFSELQFGYNGAPDFSLSQTVLSLNENSGPQTRAAFATGITAGLGDVGQTVSLVCTNNNNALFSTQPAIATDGTLTFTTAPDAYGSATVTVVATDNLGSASAPKTFRVDVAIVPSISRSASSLGNFTSATGTASASQSFTINGRGLSGILTLTAPTGFEISTDNSTFSSTLKWNRPAGTIQSVYRGAFGNYTTASGNIWYAGSGTEFPNGYAFAAITPNGSVVSWGNPAYGGNSTSVTGSLSSNVTAVYSNLLAFAALKSDGSVVTWGDAFSGGNSSSVAGSLSSNVTAVYSTERAFAALKSDGSVVTWGNSTYGGDSSSVGGSLSSNVTAVYSSRFAFAALKADGSVVTWGDAMSGGNSSSVSGNLSSNVTAVYSNRNAFAALKNNGSVVTWGFATWGGNSSSVSGNLSSNVTAVYSNTQAFAALKRDGSVVTWGDATYGGNSSSVSGNLSSNVTAVYSNFGAFAALKGDGSVVTWGWADFGGDSSSVSGNLSSNVTAVYATASAFAALKNDGSVVTWGDTSQGGNSSSVSGNLSSNVTAVYSTASAFAALKNDGSVVTWGNGFSGGNSTSVAASLSSNVTAVYSSYSAFAALKSDGSVVSWGDATYGGSGAPPNIGTADPLPATIYARLASTAPLGSNSGNITLASTGATTQSITVNGTVSGVITTSVSSLTGFITANGTASAAQSFTVNASVPNAPPAVASNYFDSFSTTWLPAGALVNTLAGTVDQQNGWTTRDAFTSCSTVGRWDQQVVAVNDANGNRKVFRMSNANATATYTSQVFSATSAQVAGETGASLWNNRGTNGASPLSPTQFGANATTDTFYTKFTFRSATGAAQSGLQVTLSPSAKQSSVRMSWLQLQDTGSGFNVNFQDSGGQNSTGVPFLNFPASTTVASGLSYTDAHTVEMEITFVDGVTNVGGVITGNDLVKIYVNGALVHTGTTWESYYYTAPGERNAVTSGPGPRLQAVNAMLFRAVNPAAPANSGKGFYFEDFAIGNTIPTPAGLTLTAPAGFEVSSDNSTFGGNATIALSSTAYVRIASNAAPGAVSGNLVISAPNYTSATVALSGTVGSVATPAITASPASLSGFTASLGSASTALPFLVGGSDLTANITISAPAGFEISGTGDAPFAPSLNLEPVSGTVASTSIYARLAASAPAGANSGNITLASTGATSQQVAVSGTVTLPYEDWVAYWNTQSGSFSGATALGSADPDSDGYSNTTEFAFDGDPLSPTASLITVAPSGGNLTVTFLARVGNGTIWSGGNATGNGLNYEIQSSADLMLGFDPANDVSNLAPAADQTGIQPADFPYVRWQFQAPISGEKKFYRVKAVPQGVGDQ